MADPHTPKQTTNPNPGLGYSVEHFRILGIDTPDKFAAFSLPDYDLVGVTDTEDRKRLFFLVQRVKLVRLSFSLDGSKSDYLIKRNCSR